MQILAVFFLVTVAIGGVAYVFLYPSLSGERKAEQRMQSVTKTEPLARVSRGPQKSRRDLVEIFAQGLRRTPQEKQKRTHFRSNCARRTVLVEAAIHNHFGLYRPRHGFSRRSCPAQDCLGQRASVLPGLLVFRAGSFRF